MNPIFNMIGHRYKQLPSSKCICGPRVDKQILSKKNRYQTEKTSYIENIKLQNLYSPQISCSKRVFDVISLNSCYCSVVNTPTQPCTCSLGMLSV